MHSLVHRVGSSHRVIMARMTKLLEEAVAHVRALPTNAQDRAALLLLELMRDPYEHEVDDK